MRKFGVIAACALVVAPSAFAGPPAQASDRANAVRDCKALRASMGISTFRSTYGTVQANRLNAFGRCVSAWTREERENRVEAVQDCRTEREALGAAAFRAKYGGGSNAFGRCVSMLRRSERAADREATLNAAQTCKAERGTTPESRAAFNATYGKNENDRNAFGKCVSMHARAAD
jgi:hypothetical protein